MAYEDEGAIRFRMPDEGVTAWDDAVLGPIEVPNEKLEDVVLVRSDGRPTYNFANPVEDMDDAITHVIRGRDHVSNTPKQLRILAALGHEPPVYAHVPDVLGDDGKKLSKRHGATSVDEFRAAGYLPQALMNFLALLGWAPDGETTIMPPDELVERFTLERVGASPATLDYQKLDWMNGVYLRALDAGAYADALVTYLREQGYDWPEERIRAAAPLVQEKIERLGQFPEFAGFLFERRNGYDRGGARRRRARRRRGDAGRAGAVHRGGDRAGAAGPRGADRAEAASGVPADPRRGHRVDRLARPVREHRAARPRRDARPDPGGEVGRVLIAYGRWTSSAPATSAMPAAQRGQRMSAAPATNVTAPSTARPLAAAAEYGLRLGVGRGSGSGCSPSRRRASRTRKSAPRHSKSSSSGRLAARRTRSRRPSPRSHRGRRSVSREARRGRRARPRAARRRRAARSTMQPVLERPEGAERSPRPSRSGRRRSRRAHAACRDRPLQKPAIVPA